MNQLLDTRETDDQRIDQIRSQIDDDSYIVNIRQIADKVIDIEIALTKPRKQSS